MNLKSKEEVDLLISKARQLAIEQSQLLEKFSNFYFGMIQPFEIVTVDFELFKSMFHEHNPKEVSIKHEQLTFEIIAAELREPKRVKVAIDLRCDLSSDVLQFYNDLRKTVVLH